MPGEENGNPREGEQNNFYCCGQGKTYLERLRGKRRIELAEGPEGKRPWVKGQMAGGISLKEQRGGITALSYGVGGVGGGKRGDGLRYLRGQGALSVFGCREKEEKTGLSTRWKWGWRGGHKNFYPTGRKSKSHKVPDKEWEKRVLVKLMTAET